MARKTVKEKGSAKAEPSVEPDARSEGQDAPWYFYDDLAQGGTIPTPAIEKLRGSVEYPRIASAIAALPGRPDVNDIGLAMALSRALGGPLPHERFTRIERVKTAERIAVLAAELSQLLYRLHGDKESQRDWPFEFQAMIDRMALLAAVDFRESVGVANESELAAALADDDGEAFHAVRSGINHALIDCMPEILAMLADAAQWWEEDGKQTLAKPNHKNAARLYFIRELTKHFVSYYGKPLRDLTLTLTSVYFDCSDLDVAALSHLAPVSEQMKHRHRDWKTCPQN